MNKFFELLDKVGKRNIILVVIVLIALVITGLYATFSLYTASYGVSIVDGVKTYRFILDNSTKDNSVIISGNSTKNIDIVVSNPDEVNLKYGLYYSSSDKLDEVYVGYREEFGNKAQGVIEGGDKYIINVRIVNLSLDSVEINFGVTYGLEKGGDIVLPGGKMFVDVYNGPFLLNEVKVGSYVHYEGNNGCQGNSCKGENVNYINDADMGFCVNKEYSYNASGFRVGYIRNSTAYLISAGALECVSTDKSGMISNIDVDSYEVGSNSTLTRANLNREAIKYCNSDYVYGGVCDGNSSWAMDVMDFKNITGNVLSSNSCFGKDNSKECGYENDLLDNGGYYWFSNNDNALKSSLFGWDPNFRRINHFYSNYALGLRPVIRLREDVYVVSGEGSYLDPYELKIMDDDILEMDIGNED